MGGRQSLPEKDITNNEKETKCEDTAPDAFINEIYSTEGRQALPENESDLSLPEESRSETDDIKDENSEDKVSIASNDLIIVHEKETTIQKDIVDQENESNDRPKESDIEEKAKELKVLDILSMPKEENKFEPGVLELTVLKASQLVNNDKIGQSDPYVKIIYKNEEFRSKTVKNTLEPEWNYTCEIDIPDQKEKYIHINVYDDDFGKDNIEGCYSLSVNEAISDIPEEGRWYSLIGCKTGKVFISTKFTPIKMEDASTEKPVEESSTKVRSSDLEVEKIVGEIVQKAEKVIGEVQAQLNETESSVNITKESRKVTEKSAEDKDDEFIKISKESEEIIQKME